MRVYATRAGADGDRHVEKIRAMLNGVHAGDLAADMGA